MWPERTAFAGRRTWQALLPVELGALDTSRGLAANAPCPIYRLAVSTDQF